MRNLAKTLGVADRVRITGYLAEKELEYYLVATDIPVCPYKVCYASGSLSSWLSAGRLVLASALPQFQEYNRIEPGTIRTFSPYTPMALAHAIQAMLALSSPGVNDMVLRLRDQLAIQVIFDKHLQYIINPLRF